MELLIFCLKACKKRRGNRLGPEEAQSPGGKLGGKTGGGMKLDGGCKARPFSEEVGKVDD